jgi:hypothetical protein
MTNTLKLAWVRLVNTWRVFGARHGAVAQWVLLYGSTLAATWMLLFVLTAAAGGDDGHSGAGLALEIALGSRSPFAARTEWAAVLLAVASTLIMPAAVGAAAALVVSGQVRRFRELPMDEILRRMDVSERVSIAELLADYHAQFGATADQGERDGQAATHDLEPGSHGGKRGAG